MDRVNIEPIASEKSFWSGDYFKFFLESLILSISVLMFTFPYKWLIFGQDSIPIIHVFSYYSNPLYPYRNDLSAIYYDLAISSIQSIIRNVAISERLLLALFVFLSSFFLLDFFKILLGSHRNTKFPYVASAVAIIFYQYNLFTLSVTWPHILVWTLLMVSAPLIVSFLTYTLFFGVSVKRLSLTSFFMFIFASSISNDYLPFFIIIVLVFILFGICQFIRLKQDRKKNIIIIFVILLFVMAMVLWSNIPLYFSSIYSNLQIDSQSFYLSFAKSESVHTTLWNVISLSGYSWLYGGPPYGPGAYPWYQYFNFLKLINKIFIPIIILFALYYLKDNKQLRPLALISLFAIIFSTGTNPPFGQVNILLLSFKGLFLFLVNPYYFILQFYVLFLSAAIFLTLFQLTKSQGSLKFLSHRPPRIKFTVKNFIRKISKYAVIVLIIILIVSNFFPFLSDNVYQKHGDNIDVIDINNGIPALDSYLEKTNSAPDYLSILLPLSSFDGRDSLTYNNNSTFIDSVGLVQTFDPYPLIWQDNSNVSTIIENYFGNNNFQDMRLVLDYLHVRYIIYTHDFPREYNYMIRSPNGEYYNMTNIFTNLKSNFGPPRVFGNYSLFTVSGVEPVAGIIDNPAFINLNFSEYVSFLSSINGNNFKNSTKTLLQSAIPGTKVPDMYIYSYNPNKASYFIGNSSSYYFVNYSGTLSIVSQAYIQSTREGRYINISPELIYQQSDKDYNYFKLKDKVSAGKMVNVSIAPNMERPNQRFTFESRFGEDYVNVSVYNDTKFYDIYISANSDVLHKNGNYAWDNIIIPYNVKISNISIWYRHGDEITVTYSSSGEQFQNVKTFYYGASNYFLDMGYSTENFLKNMSINGSGIFSILGGPFNLSSLHLYSVPPITYILSYNGSKNPSFKKESISTTIFGNYKINATIGNDSYLYFFDYPGIPWYVTIKTVTYTSVFHSDSFLLFDISVKTESSESIYLHTEYLTKVSFYASIVEIIILWVLWSINIIKKHYHRK